MVQDNKRPKTLFVIQIKTFQTTCQLSDKFFDELQRHNYVTPTSYLELISTFKVLLDKKRVEVHKLKRRYEVGLEKLESAAGQVRIRHRFGGLRTCSQERIYKSGVNAVKRFRIVGINEESSFPELEF